MNKYYCAMGILAIATLLIGSTEKTTIAVAKPVEIDEPLANPYCGWGIWLGPRYFDGRVFSNEYNTTGFGDDAPLFTWAVVDWMWSDLEPREGQFYWAQFDSIINYWKERNKQFLVRIWVTDDPGWAGDPGSTACPDWLWEKGVKYHSYAGEANTPKREPDYIDPSYDKIYRPCLNDFLMAFCRRYQNPKSNMIMFQVMGYGQWGEWHTMWSNYQWPNRETKHKVLSKTVQQYMDVFDSTKLAISYCFDNDLKLVRSAEDFAYRQGTDIALANDFCLTRHGFIDGLLWMDKQIMVNNWKHCPLLAEGDWSYLDLKNHGTHGTFDQNLDVMLEWHSIFAHFYTDAENYLRMMKEDKTTVERGLKPGGLGYRLVLTSASWDREISAGRLLVLKQTWENRNVGWCMKNFPLKIFLTDKEGNESPLDESLKYSRRDGGFDITHLYKGEVYYHSTMFTLPKALPAGEYDLRIALVDETGKPAVKLGIEGVDKQGRYLLGPIKILPLNPKDVVFW